jgi:hypothetical protein
MALGFERWENAWTDSDLASVQGQGVGDLEPWLTRHGLKRLTDYRTVYVAGADLEAVCKLLWCRPALVSVHSLNLPESNHLIFWDGERVFDPSFERTYLHLRSCVIDRVVVFAASAPRAR